MNKQTDRSDVRHDRTSYVLRVSFIVVVVVVAATFLRLTQRACCDLLNKEKNNTWYAIIRTFPEKDVNSMKSGYFPGKRHSLNEVR